MMPQWNGLPLAGRRIVLFAEQGLGDTLQFVRFCQVLKRQGAGEVILECPERLADVLLRMPGIDQFVLPGEPLPDYDVYCPLMNLAGLTATSVESIPSEALRLRRPRPRRALASRAGRRRGDQGRN